MSWPAMPSRLPQSPVRAVLVSGEYPQLAQALGRRGITTVTTRPDPRLPEPVQWHPDLQAGLLGGRIITLQGGPLAGILRGYGVMAEETCQEPGETYPKDALCNVLTWDKWVVGNLKSADERIVQRAMQLGLAWVQVNQGYTACSTAMVDRHSAMTADPGVSRKLQEIGIQVLTVAPGHIRLPGYACGFLGGCCCKLGPDVMAFTGQLNRHPDGEKIRLFLMERQIAPIELLDGELLDVGGILPLA